MGAERRLAVADDARPGAYFTDGSVLYEVYARREAPPKTGSVGGPVRGDECLLGDASNEQGPEAAEWVPVDEVEGLRVVREAPRELSPEIVRESIAAMEKTLPRDRRRVS